MTWKSSAKLKTGQVISREFLLETDTSEHQEQTKLFQWMAVQHHYPELSLFYAIPNQMKPETIGRKKREGLKTGVPDICGPVPRGKYHGMYIELKTGNNKPTNEQGWWLAQLRRQGYHAVVAHGWMAASKEILAYLKET